jgi:ABC-type sulfate/molybdate transport systems ATPase subunit
VLFGPSGAGKTLTLRVIAGLHAPRPGAKIVAGDVDLTDVPAHRRGIGYVPQHHALFPFCDVLANVTFGLPRARRRADDPGIRALLADLGIERLARARPDSLSGGERQRVALARALAPRPRLLLLDEPFASLDRDARAELRAVLRSTLERHAMPAVFVTHDREEALALGDRVARYERGRTVQVGAPRELLGGRTLTITGKAQEGAGRVEVADAVVEGPDDVVRVGADGGVRIRVEI